MPQSIVAELFELFGIQFEQHSVEGLMLAIETGLLRLT